MFCPPSSNNSQVWSDPAEGSGWMENDRGISCTFGADVMKQCMEDLGVEFICRTRFGQVR